jgi:hypothetical protein
MEAITKWFSGIGKRLTGVSLPIFAVYVVKTTASSRMGVFFNLKGRSRIPFVSHSMSMRPRNTAKPSTRRQV